MATPETRRQLQAAVQACDDKKGEDTRILELDPADSGLADFFLITSASNDRQVVAIADEIELRLKKDFGVYATSVEGRRQAEWILLDYSDIVIHVFLAEKRAFYDIERLRKSARSLTSGELDAELEAELRSTLAARTRAVRNSAPKSKSPKKAVKVLTSKSPATSVSTLKTSPAKTSPKGDSIVTAKPAKKASGKAAKSAPKKAAKTLNVKAGKELKVKSAATRASSSKTAPKSPIKSASKSASKPASKAAKEPAAAARVGVFAPTSGAFGAKPPILERCVDPDAPGVAGQVDSVESGALGAKPPILKCDDPDETSAASPAVTSPKAAKPSAGKAAAKSVRPPPAKSAIKAAKKAAAKKSKR